MTDNKHPDRKQCLEYLREYNTPKHVIGHCKSVAAVAFRLGQFLNEAGGTNALPMDDIEIEKYISEKDGGREVYRQKKCPEGDARNLDLELVLAAGLLHDMARVEDRHWDVCADFIEKRGYDQEAKLIRPHMMYEFTNDACHITELDLLCLGDRLSLEDRFVGLDERMEYIIKKAERNGNFNARPRILEKKEEARKLLTGIEEITRHTVEEMMKELDYENAENCKLG